MAENPYLIVGSYAVVKYGEPRYMKDPTLALSREFRGHANRPGEQAINRECRNRTQPFRPSFDRSFQILTEEPAVCEVRWDDACSDIC